MYTYFLGISLLFILLIFQAFCCSIIHLHKNLGFMEGLNNIFFYPFLVLSIKYFIIKVVWLSLFFEILQEMLILPLYNTFGSTIEDMQKTGNKIKTGALVVTVIFTISAIILYFLMPDLVKLMGNKDLIDETVDYVR